jgi:hypothetical protein
VSVTASLVNAYFEGQIDGTPPNAQSTPLGSVYSLCNVILEFVATVGGSPLWSQTQPTVVAIGTFVWGCVSNAVDAVFLAANFKVPELSGDVPVILASLFGAGALIWNLASAMLGEVPWWAGICQVAGCLPGPTKWVRILSIYLQPEFRGGIVVLQRMDWICLPLGALAGFLATSIAIQPATQSATSG